MVNRNTIFTIVNIIRFLFHYLTIHYFCSVRKEKKLGIKKKIFLTVTNDLNYDQRMIRICNALNNAGYEVTLIGWEWPSSHPIVEKSFHQVRLKLPMTRGKLMYLVYWLKLFFYLLPKKIDAICSIDLDTILPVYLLSKIKNTKRIYDAHEIFTEMQEVNQRPMVKKMWELIGNFCVPKFPIGYSIGDSYVDFFRKKYGVNYETVRNATVLKDFSVPEKKDKYILYQGAVNVGRCFEQLIPAMKDVNEKLIIIGKGNFLEAVKNMVTAHNLEEKVNILGYLRPDELKKYTENAWIGITLFDNSNNGLSNQFSMANRFFDYMHHGVPQLCNNYPEYKKVNEKFGLGLLIDELTSESIAYNLNLLLEDNALHKRLSDGAMQARLEYNWQAEEQKLLQVYKKVFKS